LSCPPNGVKYVFECLLKIITPLYHGDFKLNSNGEWDHTKKMLNNSDVCVFFCELMESDYKMDSKAFYAVREVYSRVGKLTFEVVSRQSMCAATIAKWIDNLYDAYAQENGVQALPEPVAEEELKDTVVVQELSASRRVDSRIDSKIRSASKSQDKRARTGLLNRKTLYEILHMKAPPAYVSYTLWCLLTCLKPGLESQFEFPETCNWKEIKTLLFNNEFIREANEVTESYTMDEVTFSELSRMFVADRLDVNKAKGSSMVTGCIAEWVMEKYTCCENRFEEENKKKYQRDLEALRQRENEIMKQKLETERIRQEQLGKEKETVKVVPKPEVAVELVQTQDDKVLLRQFLDDLQDLRTDFKEFNMKAFRTSISELIKLNNPPELIKEIAWVMYLWLDLPQSTRYYFDDNKTNCDEFKTARQALKNRHNLDALVNYDAEKTSVTVFESVQTRIIKPKKTKNAFTETDLIVQWVQLQIKIYELCRNIRDLRAGKKIVLPKKQVVVNEPKMNGAVHKEEPVTNNPELNNLTKHMNDLKEFSSTLMRVEVGKKFISEIKTMKHPPVMIVELMTCICHMLKAKDVIVGYERNREPVIDWWATSCGMMSHVDFYQQLVNYDNFKQMDESVYNLLCRRWGSAASGWNMNNFNNQSNASAKLFEWVKCQMEIYALRMRYAHVAKSS